MGTKSFLAATQTDHSVIRLAPSLLRVPVIVCMGCSYPMAMARSASGSHLHDYHPNYIDKETVFNSRYSSMEIINESPNDSRPILASEGNHHTKRGQ